MYCSSCGTQVAENSTFCVGCGRPVQTIQTAGPAPIKGSGCLLIGGIILATFGVLMSFTVIGAIIGVPMAIIGGAIAGWQFVKLSRR